MPTRPPVLGARTLQQRRADHDRLRREASPWRAWYSTAAWRARRAAQLQRQPLCERHLAQGMVVAATVANHKVPHRGDWELFIRGELESACKACHDGPIQAEERAATRR